MTTNESKVAAVTAALGGYMLHFERRLDEAVAAFKKDPEQKHWTELERQMLVYQQAKLYGEARGFRVLEGIPIEEWDEALVHETTDETIDEILHPEKYIRG